MPHRIVSEYSDNEIDNHVVGGGASVILSSQSDVTSIALHLMKLVEIRSQPHTRKCPTNFAHCENIFHRVLLTFKSGESDLPIVISPTSFSESLVLGGRRDENFVIFVHCVSFFFHLRHCLHVLAYSAYKLYPLDTFVFCFYLHEKVGDPQIFYDFDFAQEVLFWHVSLYLRILTHIRC